MSARCSSSLCFLPGLLLVCLLPVFAAMPRRHTEPRPLLKRVPATQLGDPSHTELFTMYDVDSDGFLTPMELVLLLQRPDHVNEVDEFVYRLKTVFTVSETNGDGKLDLAEFTKAVSAPPRAPTQSEATGTFELFDENGDQLLNYAEIAKAIQRMTGTAPSSDMIEQMFSRTDTDGDGAIDQIEFARAMQVQDRTDIQI